MQLQVRLCLIQMDYASTIQVLSHYTREVTADYTYLFRCVGNLYIADYGNSRIRKVVVSTGIISTIAGTSAPGFSGDGGSATSAALYNPAGVATESIGKDYNKSTTQLKVTNCDLSYRYLHQ